MAAEDIFRPFRELMIPLSGVIKMFLLQRGDKKIFLIGERHTHEFCRDKGLTPLCSIIDTYLQTRTDDAPVDFMIEMENEHKYMPPLEEIQAIAVNDVNVKSPYYGDVMPIIDLVRDIVAQYIPPVSNPTSSLPPRTVVTLPNARVHWLDPTFSNPTTPGDMLFHYLVSNKNRQYQMWNENNSLTLNHNQLTTLYISRTIINHNLNIPPNSPEASWALPDLRLMSVYERQGYLETIPDRELFLQSTDESKLSFVKRVYDMLASSKFFKKCYGDARFIKWEILRRVFLKSWRHQSSNPERNTIEEFYFMVERFFMDFFTCCRLLKDEGRWYKNIVIYAGALHTNNIGRMLYSLGFTNIPLPDIPYNPTCSATGGKKSRKRKRKKRKTRR